MRNKDKAKVQPIHDVEELRQKVFELETTITELRQSTEAVKSKKAYLQKILNMIPTYIFLKDREHRLTHVNEALVKATGRPKHEWIGKTVFELFPDRDLAKKYYQEDEEVMSCGGYPKANIIEKLPTPEGMQCLHTHKVPLKNEKGQVVGLLTSSINITERKEFEDTLNKSEQEKTSILDSLVEHVVYQDPEMRILWANRAACESANMARQELLGRHCYEIWADSLSPCEDCPVIESSETGQPQLVEKMTPDGRWWYIQGHPVRDSKGHVTGMTEVTLDITQRRRAEEALRKAKDELEMRVEERTAELAEANENIRKEIAVRKKAEKKLQDSEMLLSSAFDALQDLVVVIDKDYRVRMSNLKDHNYISEKDRQDHPFCYEVFKSRKTPCNPCHAMEVFATGEIKHLEETNPIDGKTSDIRVIPIFDDEGKVDSVIQHVRDISELKRAQSVIRELTHQLIKTQENERHMISLELHDRIAQDLIGIKYACETLLSDFPSLPEEIKKQCYNLLQMLQKSISEVRDLSYDLLPPGLDQLGFAKIVYQYVQEFSEKTGLSVDFRSADLEDLTLDYDTKINLYRMVQEGLNNVRKHADADHITVSLQASFPNIILRIKDDGKGFDVEKRRTEADGEKKMGLRSIEERALLLKGEMTIRSTPANGTEITIEVPFEEKPDG